VQRGMVVIAQVAPEPDQCVAGVGGWCSHRHFMQGLVSSVAAYQGSTARSPVDTHPWCRRANDAHAAFATFSVDGAELRIR
jgi:hypothetical protein